MGVDMIFSMDSGEEQGHVGTRKFGGKDGGFGRVLTGEHELQVGLSRFPLLSLLLFPLSPHTRVNPPPRLIAVYLSTPTSKLDLLSVPPLFRVNVVRH